MTYIFVFLGEFGFEILNWQGVIRKFAQTIEPGDKIVCCSRADLYLLYEKADLYIDISDVKSFQQSRASGYHAMPNEFSVWHSAGHRRFERRLKTDLHTYIQERLRKTGELGDARRCAFVFSSDGIELNGCRFGLVGYRRNPTLATLISLYRRLETALSVDNATTGKLQSWLYRFLPTHDYRSAGGIYGSLEAKNNIYRKLEPDLGVLPSVRDQLGWDLSEPFVLCQTRYRETRQVSRELLPRVEIRKLIDRIAERIKVVLLSFDTGRAFDSYSRFEDSAGCFNYRCRSLPEQACLISFAKHCLFFSEGDLGSHVYVPPMMGKDVSVVAPQSIYQLESAPLDFWNRDVFRFGGRIIPLASEDVLATESTIRQTARRVLSTKATA